MNYSINLREMSQTNINEKDLSAKIMEALGRAIQRLKVETKATNTYLVVSDGKGGAKKIYAKDL